MVCLQIVQHLAFEEAVDATCLFCQQYTLSAGLCNTTYLSAPLQFNNPLQLAINVHEYIDILYGPCQIASFPKHLIGLSWH